MKKAVVVGSGSIAKRHIRNLRQLFPEAEVVCVSSSGRPLNAVDLNVHSTSNSLDDTISGGLDLAIIASPSTYHLSHALPFIRANISVLIEKPLCAQLSEIDGCSLSDPKIKLGVGYNLRFMPSAKKVKQLIDDGRLGKISTVFAEVGQYLPDWRPDIDYRSGVSAQKKLGGGALLELSHEIDYLIWMFGSFREVSGRIRNTNQLDIDVEDSVDAILINHSGILVHLHLDFLQRAVSRVLKVVGEYGTLTWDLIRNEINFVDGLNESKIIFSDADYDRNEMYLEQLRAFVDFTKGEAKFESDISNGTTVMRLIEAIRLSDKKRSWVKLGDVG